MSIPDDTFRFQLRFSRLEYPDLTQDLERFEGAARGNRARLLLRLGLAVLNGDPVPDHGRQGKVVDLQRPVVHAVSASAPAPTASAAPKRPVQLAAASSAAPEADVLEGLGMDPANFQFGTSK